MEGYHIKQITYTFENNHYVYTNTILLSVSVRREYRKLINQIEGRKTGQKKCEEKGGLRKFKIWWQKTSLFIFNTAAHAAKSLQSCPTLCDPVDGSPPGSSVHGILQARTLEWVAIAFSYFILINIKYKQSKFTNLKKTEKWIRLRKRISYIILTRNISEIN